MLQQFWDLNDKYLQKGTNLKTIRGFKESRLWKTANENLYHLIKFSLYLSFTVHYLYKEVSCFLPVLYIRIVLSCFYLLIFYFEKFSSWIWHLLFAVSMTLNLSNNNKIYHRVKSKNHHISQLIRKHTTYLNLSWSSFQAILIKSFHSAVCWFHHSGFSIPNTRQGVCILPVGIFYWDPYSLMFTSFLVALNKTLNPLSSGNILSLTQSLRQPSVLNRCTARR